MELLQVFIFSIQFPLEKNMLKEGVIPSHVKITKSKFGLSLASLILAVMIKLTLHLDFVLLPTLEINIVHIYICWDLAAIFSLIYNSTFYKVNFFVRWVIHRLVAQRL